MHNTRGDQTKNRFLAVDHECVASIVAAVETDNALYAFGEPVNDLAFAFVAPLSADNDYIFYSFHPLKKLTVRRTSRYRPNTIDTN